MTTGRHRSVGAPRAALALLALLIPNTLRAQAPPISLDGRESVEQMRQFEPFFGAWKRVESPPGTPVSVTGGCTFEKSNHGMTVNYRCGPENDAAESTTIFWHPTDRKLVYQMYSVRFPTDLLFVGVVEFPEPNTIHFIYRGHYGDGRILTYRETKRIATDGRLFTTTEEFKLRKWNQIFAGSVYTRAQLP
jgi:hypothetical protein